MTKRNFNYSMIRIVCQGKIKTCDFCKDNKDNETIKEGYCAKCGRPLWKKSGDNCGFIVGYKDRNYRQQNKVHIKCKFCNTVTSV
jgi:hypothetical protein